MNSREAPRKSRYLRNTIFRNSPQFYNSGTQCLAKILLILDSICLYKIV